MHDLIVRIKQEHTTEILRAQWNAVMPFMAMGFLKSLDFNEYRERCSNYTSIDLRSNEEILAEVEEIRKQMKEEG